MATGKNSPAGVHKPFEIRVRVRPEEIDELGHVNNVHYLRWVQDAAVAHWRALAPKEDQERFLWVVLRHEIDYRHAAKPGDELVVRTWVGGSTRISFERLTEIRRAADGQVLAKARTLWCPIDARTRRPVQVSARVRELFTRSRAD
jgi:acyl-CoA thioester hydrolase